MFLLSVFNTSAIESQLQLDRKKLINRIREQLHHSNDPALMSLAEKVAKAGDEEIEELLGGVDAAILSHDISELLQINLALQRVSNGTYGICADCGRAIEAARLKMRPAACWCQECKTAFEKRRGIVMNPEVS